MNVFLGTSASPGIGIGQAFVIPETVKRVIPRNKIEESSHDKHWSRLEKSLATVSADISKKMADSKDNKIQSQLYETYFLMLNDPEFIKES